VTLPSNQVVKSSISNFSIHAWVAPVALALQWRSQCAEGMHRSFHKVGDLWSLADIACNGYRRPGPYRSLTASARAWQASWRGLKMQLGAVLGHALADSLADPFARAVITTTGTQIKSSTYSPMAMPIPPLTYGTLPVVKLERRSANRLRLPQPQRLTHPTQG